MVKIAMHLEFTAAASPASTVCYAWFMHQSTNVTQCHAELTSLPRLKIHGSEAAKRYRHLPFATGLWVRWYGILLQVYYLCKLLVLYYRPDPGNITR